MGSAIVIKGNFVMALTYEAAMSKYEPTLGLEVHVELNTKSKMFCSCATEFGAQPNTQTCPVCLGLPGSLPVVNGRAVESAILIGLALNCSVTPFSRFARKNYFYPDMPKNFQTSQYDEPICTNGYLDVVIETDEGPRDFRIEIERVHMEEDTGKSLHMGGATGRIHGAEYSLLDYNRAGIPLVEIVTKIVPGTGKYAPEVARAYVTELRDILRGNIAFGRHSQWGQRVTVNTDLPRGKHHAARLSGQVGDARPLQIGRHIFIAGDRLIGRVRGIVEYGYLARHRARPIQNA